MAKRCGASYVKKDFSLVFGTEPKECIWEEQADSLVVYGTLGKSRALER